MPTETTGEGSNGNSRRRGRRGGRRERGDRPQQSGEGQVDNVVEQNVDAAPVAVTAPVGISGRGYCASGAPVIQETAPVV